MIQKRSKNKEKIMQNQRKYIEININSKFSLKRASVKVVGFREFDEWESLESFFQVNIVAESITCEASFFEELVKEKDIFDFITGLFQREEVEQREMKIFVDQLLPESSAGYSNHGWFTFHCENVEIDLKNNKIVCK